jgi:hypothetical protein
MKCKNIECENETKGKNIYCSLSCRNIYVNKYLRNYDKYSDTIKEKNNLKEIEYLKSPKTCKCGEIIPFSIRVLQNLQTPKKIIHYVKII